MTAIAQPPTTKVTAAELNRSADAMEAFIGKAEVNPPQLNSPSGGISRPNFPANICCRYDRARRRRPEMRARLGFSHLGLACPAARLFKGAEDGVLEAVHAPAAFHQHRPLSRMVTACEPGNLSIMCRRQRLAARAASREPVESGFAAGPGPWPARRATTADCRVARPAPPQYDQRTVLSGLGRDRDAWAGDVGEGEVVFVFLGGVQPEDGVQPVEQGAQVGDVGGVGLGRGRCRR